jgi:uncharacterized protein YbjT (DUF2867 family)
MRIAVVGGTGTVGRHIASALALQGEDVRVLSRHTEHPVDLTTGAGLEEALAGCQVVIDASNGPASAKARAVLVDGSRRLLEAGTRAGVKHHVCLSIVGIDHVPMAYYRVKVEQESVVEAADLPWTIVRATQFHDLLGGMLGAAGRWRILPATRARFQPVDTREVAEAVVAAALVEPLRGRRTVAGPEVHDLRALARMWRETTGRRAILVPMAVPGKLARALNEGRLTCADPDVRGTRTFAAWLKDSSALGDQQAA